MQVKNYVASIPVLRFLGLKFLKRFNYSFKWKHDITKRPFFLELFKHKGYWYYGKNREKSEINCFYKLIKKGDKVLEVGAHIGYVTQIFEKIVGKEGEVIALMMYLGDPPRLTEHFLVKNESKCLEMKQIAEETSFAYYECARVEAVLVGKKIVSIINELEILE